MIRSRVATGGLCAALVLCAASSGRAQGDREPASGDPLRPREPQYALLDDGEVIVIGGTAPSEPGSSSTRTVDQETLALVPRRSADDLLRLVPGLYIAQHASEGKAQQFFLRGFDAVHGSDIAVSVAGVGLNEPSNVHGHGYVDLGFVIPEVVSALSARKGSFSLSQGDFATAGSIAFELGVAERGARVGYEVGSTNRHRVLGIVAPEKWSEASFFAAEAMRDSGFGQNRDTERLSGLAQHRWRLSDQRWANVFAAAYAARFGEPSPVPLASYEAGAIDFYGTYNPEGEGRSTRAVLGLGFHDRSEGGVFDGRLHGQWRGLSLAENFTGFLVHPDQGDLREQHHEVASIGASAWYRRRVAGGVELVLGIDGRGDRLFQSEDQIDTDGNPWMRNRQLRATELALGAAAGARVGWGPWFRAEAGMRLDAVRIRADDELASPGPRTDAFTTVSPRLSMERTIARGWALFGAYGHGFRSPEARAVASADGTRYTTSRSAEAGVTWSTPRSLVLSATGFGVSISNEMVFDHMSGALLARNATRRIGVELGAEYRPASWLAIRSDATAVDARFVESRSPIPGAPQLLVRGEARLRHESGWRGGMQVAYMAPRPLAHGARGEAFAVIDLLGAYRTRRYELALQVDNLLNARWREGEFHYASRFDRDAPLSQIPRLHYSPGRPLGARASITLWL